MRRKYNWENYFFLFTAGIAIWRWPYLQTTSLQTDIAKWFFPLDQFQLGEQSFLVVMALSITGMIVLGAWPSRFQALLGFIFIYVWFAGSVSFGIFSSLHGYCYVALGILVAHTMKDKINSVDYSLAALVSMYFCSGVWKLIALLKSENLFTTAAISLPNHVAYGVAEHFDASRLYYIKFFQSHPTLSAIAWLTVIAGEILAPLLAVKLKINRFLVLLFLISFHILVKIIVGPEFIAHVLLLAFMALAVKLRQSYRLKE